METPHLASVHAFHVPSVPIMPPMAAFPQTPPTATQAQHSQTFQQQADTTDRSRAYKSRNKRPCDFCRYKKAACHLESQPPCELCVRYNKECTFVESPAKRRRPNENSSENGLGRNGGMNDFKHARNGSIDSNGPYGNGMVNGGGYDMQSELLGWENGVPQFQMPSMDMDSGFGAAPEFVLDPAFGDPSIGGYMGFDPISASTNTVQNLDHKPPHTTLASSIEPEPSPQSNSSGVVALDLSLPFGSTRGEPSLDQQSSSNCTMVGMSGELDPYLLARYRYDQYNEAPFQRIRLRKMNNGFARSDSVPTFFTIQHNALASKAQPQEKSETLERCRREVEDMVKDEVGRRLIRLFYRYVQPYFPILSREGGQPRNADGYPEPSSLPTCLLAAIYGHALPFCAWDEKLCVDVHAQPSADALFRIAWTTCQSGLHTPSYAELQTLLLFVQRRPTNKNVSDTPFKGVMISTAVTIAMSLGLNRDPTDWPLPEWEIKQRRRLAWATFVQDRWLALNSGRLGYIQNDDWDVEMLAEGDFSEQEQMPFDPSNAQSPPASQHFIALCSLTHLINDVQHSLYSLRASKRLHNNLEATLEAAKPLRLRLTSWHQSLPAGLLTQFNASTHATPESLHSRRKSSLSHSLDGNGSLHLAYITAKIALFRAMLRPSISDGPASLTSPALLALRTGALSAAREILTFLDSLNAAQLESFWSSYSRANFTMATSFIILLFVTATEEVDARECLEVLVAWRSLLRIKSRSCDLLNLALLRLDAVFVAGLGEVVELGEIVRRVWEEDSVGSS